MSCKSALLVALIAGLAATLPARAELPQLATAQEEQAARDWLRAAGHPFDPSAFGEAELAPLVKRLGGARIIGIGEATHGGHEDQAFKAELIKALVRTGRIDVLMLEANSAAARGFDRYVRLGEGELDPLIRSPAFFAIWQDDEFAGLLRWLRDWNSTAAHPVRVVGIDCQDSQRDARFALDFAARFDPAAGKVLRRKLGKLLPSAGREPGRFLDWYKLRKPAEIDRALTATRQLEVWFSAAPAAARADPRFAEARMAAAMAGQGLEVFKVFRPDFDPARASAADYTLRDRAMAANALQALGAGGRAVLWAHDSHVIGAAQGDPGQPGVAAVGALLAAQLGPDYQAVGFTWSQGGFWAATLADLSARSIAGAQKPAVQTQVNNRAGELGAVFDPVGAEAMWVDFSARPHTPVLDAWARRPYWRGWAGWGIVPGKWQQLDPATGDMPTAAAPGFDVVVWFRQLTPARRWPTRPAKK